MRRKILAGEHKKHTGGDDPSNKGVAIPAPEKQLKAMASLQGRMTKLQAKHAKRKKD
jgi:hypothetical protein